MGNFTISMVIFHSYVKLPEGMLHLGMEDAFFVVMDPQGPSQSQYGSEKSRKKPSKTMFFFVFTSPIFPNIGKISLKHLQPQEHWIHSISYEGNSKIQNSSKIRIQATCQRWPSHSRWWRFTTFFRLLVVAVHYLEYVLDVNPTW